MLHVRELELGLERVLRGAPPRLVLSRRRGLDAAHQRHVVGVDLDRANVDEVVVEEETGRERELAARGFEVALRGVGLGAGHRLVERELPRPRQTLTHPGLPAEPGP